MKKRIFSFVLVLAMLATMIVVPVHATEEQPETQTTEVGYCQHCKKVIPEDQWTPWDASETAPREGHYYLSTDINDQPSQITITLDDDLYRKQICLDLRGRSYTVIGFRPFLIYGIFSIMDSVGNGEIAFSGASNANGAFCQMGQKSGCKDGAGELNIYSGTLRKINTGDSKHITAYGGVVYMAGGSTLNVHGGKLVGGAVYPRLNSEGKVLTASGGTIFCTASYINIYSGTITGGVAKDGTVEKADGTTQNCEGTGGNIYAEESSVVTVFGGTVENGYAETYGGNMTIKKSTLNVQGGTITGGYSAGAGGNINMSTGGAFNMSDGVLKNGSAVTRGGNLFVNNAKIDLSISGGEIHGDLSVGLFKSLVLSGSPKIYLGNANGLRLQSTNTTKMDISGLTEGAVIYLDGVDQVFTEALENSETYLAYFKDAIRADITIDAETGALKVAQGTTGFCPHCVESGVQATWEAWHNKSSSSTSLITESESKHYYFTAAHTRKGIIKISEGVDIVFDMASKSLSTTDKKFANLYGSVSLLDSVGSGYITSTGHAKANGGVIMGSGACSFTMYSGKLSRTVKSGETNKSVLIGGILYAPATSTVNIYGGTIQGGISDSVDSYKNNPRGGIISTSGSFTMKAGALIGGAAYSTDYLSNDTEQRLQNTKGTDVTATGLGGNLYISGSATISGGHIVGGNATQGGNIYFAKSASASITGGVIRDGLANETAGLLAPETDLAIRGGNIYINTTEVSISNALLTGGSSREHGGSVYISGTTSDGVVTYGKAILRNTILSGGVAGLETGDDGRGGNLYLSGTGKCDIYNSIIGNGYALSHGGNVYGPGGVDLKLYSGMISGGSTGTGYGGNLYCSGLTMYSGVITGGKSGIYGGNIFVYEGDNYLTIDAAEGSPAPIISNGSAGSPGGNIALGKNVTATISGALIENGTGDTGNKFSSYNADNIFTNEGVTLTVEDTQIRGIASGNYMGNGIYSNGQLILKGNTTATNQEKDCGIYIDATGNLTVDAGFSGTASVAFDDSHFANATEPQGSSLAAQNSATGVFSGELFLEGAGGKEYGLPAVFALSGDPSLYVASSAVVTPSETLWYKTAQDAVDAFTAGSYLKLFGKENVVTATNDLTVDLNGNNLTVNGNINISGFDTENDDYNGNGTLIAETATVAPAYFAPNDRQYVTVANKPSYTFHRLGQGITNVVLRPNVAGIYYNAAWECDDALAGEIYTKGIALSTDHMPNAGFVTDNKVMYTQLTPENADTSVLVENIIKAGATNNDVRGTTPIYAAAYVILKNNTVIVSEDSAPQAGGVSYDIKTVAEKVDLLWPKLNDAQQNGLRSMFNRDANTLGTWKLYNLAGDVNGTAAVRPLKILTLGHSLAVDSGHMLNLIASEEGYKNSGRELVIATLYHSGCKLPAHVNYLSNDLPEYDLYLSSTETPNAPPTILKNYTMKKALTSDTWDIIIMQGGVFEIAQDATYTNGDIQTIQNYVLQYVSNPNVLFAWHMPWASPEDVELQTIYETQTGKSEANNSYKNIYKNTFTNRAEFYNAIAGCVDRHIVTDDSFVYLIPTGTAIENALSSYLVEKDLHRDYVHVSDLGRVISSYTWYCTLMGIDRLEKINLNAIPKAFLKSTADNTQDRVLTDMEKALILESVNNALANPLQMTQSQYTEAPQ